MPIVVSVDVCGFYGDYINILELFLDLRECEQKSKTTSDTSRALEEKKDVSVFKSFTELHAACISMIIMDCNYLVRHL